MEHRLGGAAFLMTILGILCFATHETIAEADPFVDEAVYSQNGYEEIILVEDGRDNATFFKYLLLDDYSEAPDNWSETNFNDSAWTFGQAPFGDREYNGVTPNTDWDTYRNDEGVDENLTILIRHSFYLYQEIILSAEFDAAFTNYCTPFLNGNQIFEEEGGNTHGMEYWNNDGNADVSKEMFNEGKNVLAVYGRDYVYGSGNQNRQWLDVQLKAEIFKSQTEPIIFGDTVTILVNGGNKGNSSATNVTINATANGTLIESFYFETMTENFSENLWIPWTPELIGINSINIEISCICNDSNITNNLFILNITTQIYSLETYLNDDTLIINQTRKVNVTFQVKNTGDLIDNVTLTTTETDLNNWNIKFTPNNFKIEPNEITNITITAQIPNEYEDGNYNLSFTVESQYNYILTRTLLESGRSGLADWKWINSTDNEELYNNTNWTMINFDDSAWENGNTPFGDNTVSGIEYKTFWDGDNYAYFRHIIYIPDISLYERGDMNINVATNNYGNHYINGIYIFGDMDEGDGHGAEYWNEEVQVYTNYLTQGTNVIASIVSNPTNTQWFDQEIIMTFPQANLWNYQTEIKNIPIFLDSTPPDTEVIDEGFYRNTTTFEVKWRDLSNSEDLEGYYIYYLEKDEITMGDWTNMGFFTNNSLNFTGIDGKTYRFKSVAKDTLGNLEYKTTYDTEMRIDLETPETILWLTEGDLQYTSLNGITLNWGPNNTNDIQLYIIEYQLSGEDTWTLIGEYIEPTQFWFVPGKDGTFNIQSIAQDYAGNLEIKEKSDITITFDREKPELKLTGVNSLTGLEGLVLEIEYKSENLSNIQLEYARLLENTEDRLEWNNIESDWTNNEIQLLTLVDGYTYYFRVTPKDLANNTNPRNPYELAIVWTNQSNNISLPNYPLKPVMSISPLHNMKITIDEDLDGIYERSLQEYIGNDLTFMKANQYWIDYINAEVVFGNGEYGYLPPLNASIHFSYEAYDISTTIDTNPPEFVRKPTYEIENHNNATITWKKVEDATGYIVEYRKNLASSSWTEINSINDVNLNEIEYEIVNLSSGFHYYRIISVDRMGYKNSNMEGELLEIFIEAEVNNIVTDNKEDNSSTLFYIIPTTLLIIAAMSAFYIMNKRAINFQENLDQPILIPIEEVENDIDLESNDNASKEFNVLAGSEFSRDLVFICEMGCKNEFPGDNSKDEVICPHCGMMGDSPL